MGVLNVVYAPHRRPLPQGERGHSIVVLTGTRDTCRLRIRISMIHAVRFMLRFALFPTLSFPRKGKPRLRKHFWIPACAGMILLSAAAIAAELSSADPRSGGDFTVAYTGRGRLCAAWPHARPRAAVAVRGRARGVCPALGRRALPVRPVGPRPALQRRGVHRLPCGERTWAPALDRRGANALDAGAAEHPGAGCARRPRPRPGLRRSAAVRRCARESARGGRGVLALARHCGCPRGRRDRRAACPGGRVSRSQFRSDRGADPVLPSSRAAGIRPRAARCCIRRRADGDR